MKNKLEKIEKHIIYKILIINKILNISNLYRVI